MRGLPHQRKSVDIQRRPFSSSYRCHIFASSGESKEPAQWLEQSSRINQTRFFSSCMFSPRPRISLVRTSKLAGVPASRVFSPLTMLS